MNVMSPISLIDAPEGSSIVFVITSDPVYTVTVEYVFVNATLPGVPTGITMLLSPLATSEVAVYVVDVVSHISFTKYSLPSVTGDTV